MKKYILLLATLAIVSCSKDIETPSSNNDSDEENVTLNFTPYTMYAMTRGAGDYVNISDVATKLDVYIICGSEVHVINQDKTEAGSSFGTVSASLKKSRTYTIYAIAHKGSAPVTLTDNIITFPDNTTTDTSFYTGTFSSATSTSLSCQMSRIVGQLYFWAMDELPENVTKFKFTINNAYTKFDVSTLTGNTVAEWIKPFNSLVAASDGYYKFKVFIIPANLTTTSQVTVKIEALTSENAVVKERTFTDINIKAGYITELKGPFFNDSEMTMTFTVLDWNTLETNEYD